MKFEPSIINSIENCAIFTLDRSNSILTWNIGAERLLGYKEEEIIGQLASIISAPDDLEQGITNEEINRAASEGRVEENRWYVRKDGTRFWGNSVLTAIRGESGEITGFVKVIRDETERRRLEEERDQLLSTLTAEQERRRQAEQVNQFKDEYIATISHKLRSPLNAIIGYTHMLRTMPDKRVRRTVEIVERNAKIQLQLIDDLLDTSRIINGKLQLEVRPIDLREIVEMAVEVVRPTAEVKGVRLRIADCESRIEAGLPMGNSAIRSPQPAIPVLGDPERLQQVIWNLLSNAVKFTSKGGSVEVELWRDDLQTHLAVRDTGEGIVADFLPYIFDSFRQADPSGTRRHGGLGLGLALVRNLVEMHGGTVKAESAGLKQGTTFTVSLPIFAESDESESDLLPTSAGIGKSERGVKLSAAPSLAGLRMLAVDDEEDTRELLAILLEQYGAEVITAASTEQTLDILSRMLSRPPDVLLVDIGMPGDDGYALLTKVRAFENERSIWRAGRLPVIAVTAYARIEDRERALAEGFDLHISKPVEPDGLAAAILSLMK